MESSSRKQTPQDYELVPTSSAIVPTQNQFQSLAEFPPLSYQEVLFSPKTPAKAIPKRDTPYFRYVTKQSPIQEVYLTPEHEVLSQTQIEPFITKLFPTDFQWFPDDLRKTRRFYELILIDSGSAEIIHRMCESDTKKINFSKIKILHVLTVSDWSNPWDLKPFTVPQALPGYSYIDYKNAWYYTLLLRPYSHSWFIFFDRRCNDNIPVWFYHWWYHFGAIDDIYPDLARVTYDYYCKHSLNKPFTRPLRFHKDTGLAWIFCWTYETIQVLPKPFPLTLCRKYKIRWWEKFDLNVLTIPKIQEILSRKNPKPQSPIPQTNSPIPPQQSPVNCPADQLKQWQEFQAFQKYLASQNVQPAASTSQNSPPIKDDPSQDAQDPYDF